MPQLHLIPQRFWAYVLSDPLAFFAILLGAVGIWRSERLFTKLDKNLEHLIDSMKKNMLGEMLTVTTSYAAFTRALQSVELDPMELPKDGAFALLTAFHFTKLLHTNLTPEEFAACRKLTRESVDKTAREYVDLLTKSGIGKPKQEIELVAPPK
jgi:hypothetical protein